MYKEQTENIYRAYQDVFNSPKGQEVLKDLMKAHYFFNSTVSENSILMAEKEGERNVILRILTILKAKPEEVLNYAR